MEIENSSRVDGLKKALQVLTDEHSLCSDSAASLDVLRNSVLSDLVNSIEIESAFYEPLMKLLKMEIEKLSNFEAIEDRDVELLNLYLQKLSDISPCWKDFVVKLNRSIDFLMRLLTLFTVKCKQQKLTDTTSSQTVLLVLALLIKQTQMFSQYDSHWKKHGLLGRLIDISKLYSQSSVSFSVTSIILNVFDNEETKERIEFDGDSSLKDLKNAINYLTTNSDAKKLLKNVNCVIALRQMLTNKMDLLCIDESKVVKKLAATLADFLRKTFISLSDDVEKRENFGMISIVLVTQPDLKYQVEARIIKKVGVLKITLSCILRQSVSVEFCEYFLKEEDSIEMFFNMLQNSRIPEFIGLLKNYTIKNMYGALLKDAHDALSYLKTFANWYKKAWSRCSNEALYNRLILKASKREDLDVNILLSLIPFTMDYKDDKDKEQKMLNCDYFKQYADKNTKKLVERTIELLLEFKNPEEVLNSRKALDALNFLAPAFLYQNHIYTASESELLGKYIKFSTDFIKCARTALGYTLSKFDVKAEKYGKEVDKIVQIGVYLSLVVLNLQNLSDRSMDFCVLFHNEDDEDSNNIKILLDFMTDEQLLTLFTQNNKNILLNFLLNAFFRGLFGSLYNVSRVAYMFQKKWAYLDVNKRLRRVSDELKSIDSYYRTVGFLTIANIISDSELENSRSLNIVQAIAELIAESTKLLNGPNPERFEIQVNEKNKIKILTYKCWHLSELIDCLCKFAINDSIKVLIYKNYDAKCWLKVLIEKGNDVEKEYAFKLLHQLCFEQKVCDAIDKDTELKNAMNAVLEGTAAGEGRKSLVEYIEGIFWLLNRTSAVLSDVKPVSEQHIMISYNTASRDRCLQIKEALEKKGYRVWIDTRDMFREVHAAMARAVEDAWCVLICVTEQYKQSTNCELEAQYTLKLKKPFIPLFMQSKYSPDSWLGIMIGNKIRIDFCKLIFEVAMNKLFKELDAVKADKEESRSKLEKVLIAQPKTQNKAVTGNRTMENNKVSAWSQIEVLTWFDVKSINPSIMALLKSCDGKTLTELYELRKQTPGVFYQLLRDDSKASICDLLAFSSELKALFEEI